MQQWNKSKNLSNPLRKVFPAFNLSRWKVFYCRSTNALTRCGASICKIPNFGFFKHNRSTENKQGIWRNA